MRRQKATDPISGCRGKMPPPVGAEIAQHGRQHRQRDEALLTVDDLEQPRLAFPNARQIATAAVEQQDGPQEIVRLFCPDAPADAGGRQDVL